jgi:hypothetical protein
MCALGVVLVFLASCTESWRPWATSLEISIDDSFLQFPPPRVQVLLHNSGPDAAYLVGCPEPPQAKLEEFVQGQWVLSRLINSDCRQRESVPWAALSAEGVFGILIEFGHSGRYRVRVPFGPEGREALREAMSPEFTVP